MTWWNSPAILDRVAFWATLLTFLTPLIFGVASLVAQRRSKQLETEAHEREITAQLTREQDRATQATKTVAELREANERLRVQAEKNDRRAAEIDARTQPRRLGPEKASALAAYLKIIPKGKIILVFMKIDPEASRFAEEIERVLISAGYTVDRYKGPLLVSVDPPGVWISLHDADDNVPFAGPLQRAFESIGISCRAMVDPSQTPPGSLTLGVGPKL